MNIFLWAIAPSNYADVVTTLQTSVNANRNPEDDGYLPDHLRINGIATMINNNAKHCVQDVGTPRINRVTGSDDVWEMVHATGDAKDSNYYPYCHVQGYYPRAFHLEQGRERTPGGQGFERWGFDGGRSGDCRGPDHRNPDPLKGCFARPDKNWHEFKPNVQCNACKRVGHEAATCNVLAIALFLDCYKSDMSEADKSQLKSKWITRWKDRVGQPAWTPRQLMRTYCDTLNITPDYLNKAMMWESWPDNSLSDDK
jgi:hypothetical protein